MCLILCSRYPKIDHIVSTDGFDLQVTHSVSGLGNIQDGAFIKINIEAYGTIDGQCYNHKGSNTPPGQNPVANADGEQTGEIDSSDNGHFDFTVEAAKDCTCGVTCSEDLANGENIFFNEGKCQIEGAKVKGVQAYEDIAAEGEPMCTGDDPDDGITCPEGCLCRVEEGAESCPNTQRWNQYSTGVVYESFTIDAVYNPTGSGIKEIERLVCPIVHTGDGEYHVGTEDNDGNFVPGECISCQLCREGLSGSNADDYCNYDGILTSHPMDEGCPSSIFSTRALRG